jgi:hypothetical protein
MAILPAGAIFHLRVRPASAPRIGRCGHRFHFSLVGDPRKSEILNFDGFDPVNPPKFPPALKFWPSLAISPTQVPYCNPRWCSSYSPTLFFSWFSNPSWHRDQIHLHFAQTHGWPETRPKPGGCGRGRGCGCNFSPAGVAVGRFLSNLPWSRPVAIPTQYHTFSRQPKFMNSSAHRRPRYVNSIIYLNLKREGILLKCTGNGEEKEISYKCLWIVNISLVHRLGISIEQSWWQLKKKWKTCGLCGCTCLIY